MSNPLHIIPGKQADKVLNKEQKRFNTLVKKIGALQDQVALVKELDLELRQLGEKRVKPVENKTLYAGRDWVFALHNHPAKHKLPNKQAERFARVMLEEIEQVLMTHTLQSDIELQELYAYYEGSGRSYAEIQADIEADEKALTAEMMNEMFGTDIDPDDLDNPEIFQEKLEAKQTAWKEAEKQRAEKQHTRKKSEAAQAAQEKREAAQASVNKTAKQIYLDLVRHFHPDKEPDELKRAEKTEIMKQITVAYEADDHLRLLELQMNLLASRENVFADFDNAQLKYFNQTLQRQVFELQKELFYSSPEGNGNIYYTLFDLNRSQMLRNIERHIRDIKQSEKQTRLNIELIRQEKLFKEFIRDYVFETDIWDW